MNKLTLIFIAFIIFHTNTIAQNYFLKGYEMNVPASNRGWDVQADETGYTLTTGSLCFNNQYCFAIIRTDLFGNVLWQNNYNEHPNDFETGRKNNIIRSSDGNLLITGTFYNPSNSERKIWLMKLNMEGDILWRQDHYVFSNLASLSISERNNGNILVGSVGNIFGLTDFTGSMSITETDANGNMLSSRTYQSPFEARDLEIVHVLVDDNILVGSKTMRSGTTDNFITFSKFNATGQLLWDREYQKVRTWTTSLILSDGRYWISGTDFEEIGEEWISKIYTNLVDTNGDIISTTTNLYQSPSWSIIANSRLYLDGNIILMGQQYREEEQKVVPWLLKMTPEGEILWERFFVHQDNPVGAPFYFEDIEITPSGDIAASLTYTQPGGLGNSRAGLLILDGNGCFNGNCDLFQPLITNTEIADLPTRKRIIQLIENPVQDQINIKWDSPVKGEFRLTTMNSQICKIKEITANVRTAEISVTDLDNGMYVLFLLSDGKVIDHKKVIIQR